jgi:hypothetical protein
MLRRFTWLVLILSLALTAFACGSEDDGNNGATDAGGGGGMTIEITAPENGGQVPATFTLEFESSEELGAPETGEHHVHVFYDGDESQYEVVGSTSFEVSGLSPGEHEITASLRNADHSAAGAEDTITVTLAPGAGTGEGENENDDGYGY